MAQFERYFAPGSYYRSRSPESLALEYCSNPAGVGGAGKADLYRAALAWKCPEKLPLLDAALAGAAQDFKKGSAEAFCYAEVRSRLKAPASAEIGARELFGRKGQEPAQVEIVGNSATVANYVDAPNSYGAVVRSNFVCTLTSTGSGWSDWETVDVQFSE